MRSGRVRVGGGVGGGGEKIRRRGDSQKRREYLKRENIPEVLNDTLKSNTNDSSLIIARDTHLSRRVVAREAPSACVWVSLCLCVCGAVYFFPVALERSAFERAV